MRCKLFNAIRLIAHGSLAVFAVSAQATTLDPVAHDASVDSITPAISPGSVSGTNDRQAESSSLGTTGLHATITIIPPIILSAAPLVLESRNDVVEIAGSNRPDKLKTAHVADDTEPLLLLTGLSLMGFVAFRRRQQPGKAGEMSGMYGVYPEGANVIGSFINALSWEEVLRRITAWAKAKESRYVCICNVHSVITATRDAEFKQVLRHADLATPDGMPVAWMLRKLGFVGQQRINGPDLMWKYCEQAASSGEAVYFYGSTFETIRLLSAKLHSAFPGLQINGVYSPPFRAEGEAEEDAIIASINESGAGVVFVGLGCPKQEKWMAAHQNRIHAVMIGVGAAFDYHAGTLQRAPLWMQRRGLEWFYRLVSDPRRLWKRYLVTNTLFIFAAIRQLYFKA